MAITLEPSIALPDPNWLLSSTAQATAALVAFVGGFILLAASEIKTRRRGFLKELALLREEYGESKKAILRASEEILNSNTQLFFQFHQFEFMRSKGNVDIEVLLNNYQPPNSNYQEMSDVALKISNIVKERYASTALDSFETDSAQKVLLLFDLRTYVNAKLRALEEGRISPPNSENLDSEFLDRTFENAGSRQDRLTTLRNCEERKRSLVVEILSVQSQLLAHSESKDLRAGLFIIFALGFTGMLVPLWMMTRRPVIHTALSRNIVFYSFSLTLAVLAIFIWQIVAGSKKTEETGYDIASRTRHPSAW